MGRDKGAMVYARGQDQRTRCAELLRPFCDEVYVSCREEQRAGIDPSLPLIIDSKPGAGPAVGILSAHFAYPKQTWLVLACDFPFLLEEDIARLVKARSAQYDATCYIHHDRTLEPLFAIWERPALVALLRDSERGRYSPNRTLESLQVFAVEPRAPRVLLNVNEPGRVLKSDHDQWGSGFLLQRVRHEAGPGILQQASQQKTRL